MYYFKKNIINEEQRVILCLEADEIRSASLCFNVQVEQTYELVTHSAASAVTFIYSFSQEFNWLFDYGCISKRGVSWPKILTLRTTLQSLLVSNTRRFISDTLTALKQKQKQKKTPQKVNPRRLTVETL